MLFDGNIIFHLAGCTRPGQLGALLRKEGLYSSLLVTWRRQREEALTPKKRDRKGKSVDRRGRLMIAVEDAIAEMGAAPACRLLGLPRASLYRRRHPVETARPRLTPPRALDPVESLLK